MEFMLWCKSQKKLHIDIHLNDIADYIVYNVTLTWNTPQLCLKPNDFLFFKMLRNALYFYDRQLSNSV